MNHSLITDCSLLNAWFLKEVLEEEAKRKKKRFEMKLILIAYNSIVTSKWEVEEVPTCLT